MTVMTDTSAQAVLELGSEFMGEAIHPGDPEFDRARAVYNGSTGPAPGADRAPHRSRGRDGRGELRAHRAAADRGPMRGHSVAGTSSCEGGVLVDLSSLKGVNVDPARGTALTQAGVLWGEYDRETQLYGTATPGGRVTTTGVGGFTLGGGYGWLSRKYGLTCDNLVAADIVTADGRLVHASESENPELLWGLRGAGANFGVVTSYELRLHPLPPLLLAGMLVVPNQDAGPLRAYRDIADGTGGAGHGDGHDPGASGGLRPAGAGRQAGPRVRRGVRRQPDEAVEALAPLRQMSARGGDGPHPADAVHRAPGDARRVRPQGLAQLPPRPAPLRAERRDHRAVPRGRARASTHR